MTPVGSILRVASRVVGERLNILTVPTHERIETLLCKTSHKFYGIQKPGFKTWNTNYAPIPENYVILNGRHGDHQIPPQVDFDLVLAQSIVQFPTAFQIAKTFHLPLVRYEHTLPVESWGKAHLDYLKGMQGDVNVFISEFSREAWGFENESNATVIHHGLDTDLFSPPADGYRKPVLLSVVNDWINRDYFCGFKYWKAATANLPTRVCGDTPGLSEPAPNVNELVKAYRQSQIFVNTSLVSPIPTALLESMACGCAAISTNTCMIPSVIEHGVNGILCETPQEMRRECERLLADPAECRRLGENARRTIEERFSLPRFVCEWNQVFHSASEVVFKG